MHELGGGYRRRRSTELDRDSVRADRSEELQQLPRVRVPRLDVLRVLGIALDAPGADRDDEREASGDEVGEHVELLLFERNVTRVAVGGDACQTEDVVRRPPAEERGEPDREVGDLG